MVITRLAQSTTPTLHGTKKTLLWLSVTNVTAQAYLFYSYDFVNDIEKECTEAEWENLPDTEEEAQALDLEQIKGDKVTCDVCNGEGEVEHEPYEPEYEPDYDDDY